MDSLNLLGAAIISRVLDIATNNTLHKHSGMDDFRHVVELTTVCRYWKDCMPPYASETLIAERSYSCDVAPRDSCIPGHETKWSTNLNYIVTMGKRNLVKEMRVVMLGLCGCRLRLTSALAALNISTAQWTGVEELFFIGEGVFYAGMKIALVEKATHLHTDISRMVSTFPGICSMGYHAFQHSCFSSGYPSHPDGASPFYFTLQRAMLNRATKLLCMFPFPSDSLLYFTGKLSRLDLNINVVKDLGRVPLFDPDILETVRLYELTATKDPWYLFKPSRNGALTFPCLRELVILYYKRLEQATPSLYSTGGLTIVFPALERLYISDSTKHVVGFHGLFGEAPYLTNISEPIDRLPFIDPEIVKTASILRFFGEEPVNPIEPRPPRSRFTQFYETPSVAIDAFLTNATFPFPALTRWYNLRVLDFRTDVATLPELTCLLSQLPKLWYLSIVCLTMDRRDVTSWQWDRSTIDDEARQIPMVDDLEPVNIKLQSLHFRSDRFIDIEGLAELTKWLPSLLELTVLNFYVDEMREELKNVNREDVEVSEFPHRG
ncbi:hypothetical protein DL89DRAFT_265770 [Linderina pennispora]|uniref:F-box domain-containing protein n=1 Tax=Linderina pennispora TaxID=61395 RepID=A0A1Y1WF50_9FUNG|nr:uncharacterized protein DL89DRAFT_265770 [Linderina pennispora]ORX72133.1 hypothetical protein DL89DRAFT_265770 [Linderina pennispora]